MSSPALMVNEVRTNTTLRKVPKYYEENCLKFVILFLPAFKMIQIFKYSSLLN